MATIGSEIRARRVALGMQQNELATLAGIPQAALSDIERDKIKLPNADIRRRLAKALGLSHLQLLIAAGELTDKEIELSGFTGVVERDDDPNADTVCEAIHAVSPITDDQREHLLFWIDAMRRKP